jgi:hypothetical protein
LACEKALLLRILGASRPFSRALSPAGSGFPFSAQLAFGLCLLIACLVPLIAAGEGGKPLYWCGRGHGESVVLVQVGLAYILKRRLLASHLLLYAELKPFHLFGGHHLGSVDCWLCQIFTRSLGTILSSFRVLRVTRRGFSPPEGYMQRTCFRRQRRSWLVCGLGLGELSGGN